MSSFISAKKRAIAATLTIAASLVTMAFATTAHAADTGTGTSTYVGAAWGVRTNTDLNCAPGAACERPSKSSGKIFGGYTFATTPYDGFKLSQSVEGMLYQIGETKASFNTASGLKNGTAKSTGLGAYYKLDMGTDEFGITGKIGATYARSTLDPAIGSAGTALIGGFSNDWFAPAIGLGMRYSLNKNVDLTADWDRLSSKHASSKTKTINNMFSVGVAYKF